MRGSAEGMLMRIGGILMQQTGARVSPCPAVLFVACVVKTENRLLSSFPANDEE